MCLRKQESRPKIVLWDDDWKQDHVIHPDIFREMSFEQARVAVEEAVYGPKWWH